MSTIENMKELEGLKQEIKNMNTVLKKLKAREKLLENNITKYLEAQGKPGFKYKGKAILSEPKTVREIPRRKKDDKERDGAAVLSKYGVGNSKNVLDEILEAMKGPMTQKNKLKIHNL